jgi:hypothetical protein
MARVIKTDDMAIKKELPMIWRISRSLRIYLKLLRVGLSGHKGSGVPGETTLVWSEYFISIYSGPRIIMRKTITTKSQRARFSF